MLSRVQLKRHHNCKYSGIDLLDTVIEATSLGLLRFSHMNALQTDPGYQKIKEITRLPDESTLRNFLSIICEQKALDQLSQVNQALLSLKAKSDEPREVWLDIDDSVLTVFGKQEEPKMDISTLSRAPFLQKGSLYLWNLRTLMPNYTVEMWPVMVSYGVS